MIAMEKRFSRRKSLDFAKGFAILLMLFAHTIPDVTGIKIFIFSFHMQIFFVICGVLMQKKYGEERISASEFWKGFKKRLRQLAVPYLVFSLVLAFFYTILEAISGNRIEIASRLLRILSLRGIDSMWFIPVYFFAEVLMRGISVCPRWKLVSWILTGACFFFVVLFADRLPARELYRFLLRVAIGFSFIALGRFLERYQFVERIHPALALIMLAAGAVLTRINGFSALGSLEIQNGVLFFLNAAIISIAILAFCSVLEKSGFKGKLLSFYGRNTIVILCTNNLLIEAIRLLDHKFTGDWLLHAGLPGCFVFSLILILAEYPLIRLSEGKLRFLFGKQMASKSGCLDHNV